MSTSKDTTVQALQDTETTKEQQVKDLESLIDRIKICMLTTVDVSGRLSSRAMRVQHQDTQMNLWLFTNNESHKMKDFDHTRQVNVSFLDSNNYDWISVSGTVEIVKHDVEMMNKMYSVDLKGWINDLGDGVHDGGPTDPRLTLLKVIPSKVHYYINDTGSTSGGQFMDMVKGVVVGKTPKVGKIRQLSQKDIEAARIILSQ